MEAGDPRKAREHIEGFAGFLPDSKQNKHFVMNQLSSDETAVRSVPFFDLGTVTWIWRRAFSTSYGSRHPARPGRRRRQAQRAQGRTAAAADRGLRRRGRARKFTRKEKPVNEGNTDRLLLSSTPRSPILLRGFLRWLRIAGVAAPNSDNVILLDYDVFPIRDPEFAKSTRILPPLFK